jgi:hypothetical protein
MSASASPTGGLRLNINRSIVAAADTKAVAAAIAAANARARDPSLPDAFNPALIDPAKAEALLTALLRPPGDAVAPLAGRALELNPMALRIGTSSPTTAASFARPFTLEVASEHGDTVIARAVAPVDCDIARDRAAEARRRTEAADREYKAATGDAIMAARLRRYALSRVWLDNAGAQAECAPNDAAAAADRDAAERTMKASVVIGGSME